MLIYLLQEQRGKVFVNSKWIFEMWFDFYTGVTIRPLKKIDLKYCLTLMLASSL